MDPFAPLQVLFQLHCRLAILQGVKLLREQFTQLV
jgi:hypothetical protein